MRPKEHHYDRQNVSAEVRKEDVEIEEKGEARRTDPRTGAAREMREREEQPHSQRRQKR